MNRQGRPTTPHAAANAASAGTITGNRGLLQEEALIFADQHPGDVRPDESDEADRADKGNRNRRKQAHRHHRFEP